MKQVVIGKHKKEVEVLSDGLFSIDGKEKGLDIEDLGNGQYSVILNDKNYSLEVIEINRPAKTMTLGINGKVQEITVKDKYDLLLDSLGMSSGASKKIKELKAPMPGLVLEVLAEKEKNMEKGSTLLILEAMKMENEIQASTAGTVVALNVEKGDTVTPDETLLEIQPE